MRLNEQIALIVRETGWSLEYIRDQPLSTLNALTSEILFQRSVERYHDRYSAAMIVATLASGKNQTYRAEDIIGEAPERRVMKENELAKEKRPDTILLADGKEYELTPVTANTLAYLEDKFGKTTDELFDGKVRFKVYISLIYARLHRKYPDLTEEQVGELLTTDVIAKSKKDLLI